MKTATTTTTGTVTVLHEYVMFVKRKIRTHLGLLSIPQSGGKMSKRLISGIIGCKDKTSSWHLNGFPDGRTLCQQCNVGQKPTVILFVPCINRHCCFSHSFSANANPKKTILHGGQPRSWSVEQGNVCNS